MKSLMQALRFDAAELKSRRDFFQITAADLKNLAEMRPVAEKHTAALVDSFYELLLEHPETRSFLRDPSMVRRLKQTQGEYFLSLFDGRCDLAYVEDRLRVGVAHERIGLEPKFYLGAYRRYMQLLMRCMRKAFKDVVDSDAHLESVQKLVYFDMALAIDAYILAGKQALARHQVAIRELSTPVIQVFERVLLLPLVGAVDSHRAQQIMENVLLRIVEAQARVIIIDIAGVPVVDTRVADHLIKTTAAIRLLGARTILTGITAQVARTVVQLGVDVSTMYTVSRLGDGLDLALKMMGKAVTPIGDAGPLRIDGAP